MPRLLPEILNFYVFTYLAHSASFLYVHPAMGTADAEIKVSLSRESRAVLGSFLFAYPQLGTADAEIKIARLALCRPELTKVFDLFNKTWDRSK